MLIYGQPHHNIISGNTIDTVKPPTAGFGIPIGIYLDGVEGPYIIENNTIKNSSGIFTNSEPFAWGAGNTMKYPHELIIRNNVVDNRPGSPLHTYSVSVGIGSNGLSSCYAYVDSAVVVHNTTYQNKANAYNLLGACAKKVGIKNNIIQTLNSSSTNIKQINTPSNSLVPFDTSNWKIDGNLYSSVAAGWLFNTSCGYKNAFAGWKNCGYDINSPVISTPNLGANQTPQPGSPAIDASAPLTTIKTSGSGTSISVVDSIYFSDGFGIQPGDAIKLGENSTKVLTITAVNYATNTITVNSPVSFTEGVGVYYNYAGAKSDIGAIESGNVTDPTPTPVQTPTPTATPTPAPKYDSKYDLNGDNKVTVMDIIDLIKYVFQ